MDRMSKGRPAKGHLMSVIKTGWQTATLEDVLSTLKNGFNCKQGKGGIGDRVSRIESISSGMFDLSRVGFTHIPDADKVKFKLRFGDILFSHINSPIHVGKTAVFDLDEDVYHGVNLLLMRPTAGLVPEYLRHYLSFLYLRGYWKGICKQSVNQASVNQQDIGRVPITFPTCKEQQKRIVAILDEAFEGIAAAKANAKTNQDQASSLLAQELSSLIARGKETWTSSTLGSSVKFIDYRGRTPEKTVSGLPLITAKNVRMGYVKDDPREFVAPESYEKWMTRGIPNKGDVLFTTEAPLANVAQLETSERVVFAQRIIIMQPDQKKLDSTFLKFLLLSPPIQRLIHEKGTGATATGIKASLLKTVTIPFPSSIKEQVRLSDMLTEVSRDADRLITLYVQKQDALDALKQSLLHQAFSGNL